VAAHRALAPAAVLAATLGLALGVSGCSGDDGGGPGPRSIGPGSGPTQLQPLPDQPSDVSATTLCGGPDPVTRSRPGGVAETSSPGMLDCGVVPLFPPEVARCPDRFVTADGTPCRYPGENAGMNVAWTLSLDPGPAAPKVLTVYVGGERLRPVLRATDTQVAWEAVAICPTDFTGDDLTDLVVTFRYVPTPGDLAVEAVDLHTAPKTVLKLETTKENDERGEGCESPVVLSLRLGDGGLHAEPGSTPEAESAPDL
jgi:hypothetical protein